MTSSSSTSSSSIHSAPVSSSQSCKYDVFLSFRGDDTRKTFVDHLYSALVDRHIRTFKDDEELPQGESIRPSLSKAIEESRIAIVIFSKNYANSSWCLEELVYIMKCRDKRGLIVKPIFYDVEPSDVRNLKNKFGEAFAKQEAKYDNKAKLWRKVLVEVSNIAGWELKNIANGHEAQAIKKIVNNIQVSMLSDVDEGLTDENLVGVRARMQDLESLLDIGSDGVVRMVGIWGVGGSGKTTLATSICMEISHHFHGYCILENVREQSSKYDLKKLQEDILLAFSKKEVTVRSVVEGKTLIQSMLHHQKVLLVLDDVDKHEQLEALGGSHEWFGGGSRIIITTRDKQLLETHKVDEIYPVRLLSHNEAIQLFNRYAYNQRDPIEDYENLSSSVVYYADGLPLALKVLGSFLYDKDNKEWMSTLSRLKDIPEDGIMETLKISYDGLKDVEKALFLDIACFFRGKRKDYAMGILEACNFYPEIGIKVLRQKALITILSNGTFDMHDLIEEMGHYIVRREHPKNPEKHSRVWKDEEISNMCLGDTTMDYENIEAMRYDNYSYDDSSRFCKIVSNMKKLRYLSVGRVDVPTYFSLRDNKSNPSKTTSNLKKLRWLRVCDRTYDRGPKFLSNELRYIDWKGYPTRRFSDSFRPMNLVVLTLENSLQKKLWKGIKHLPYLKVLMLIGMKKLLSTPNFDGLPCLQKLRLDDCYKLEEIHPSLGNLMSLEHVSIIDCDRLKIFPTIVRMENLKTLEIGYIYLKDGKIPSGIGELFNLQELNLSGNDFSSLNFSLSQLTRLKLLDLTDCVNLFKLPELPSSLTILKADRCRSLTTFGDCHKNCKRLCDVSLMEGGIIHTDGRLLDSMLEGKSIDTHFMLLLLEGVKVAKGFTTLVRGNRCRLQLPENWCNEFCGFLMCAMLTKSSYQSSYVKIRVYQGMRNIDSQHNAVWNESDSGKYTWVGYVSFASLRHTTWWDQTYNALSFDIYGNYRECRGFGVRLVDKKSESGLSETSADSNSSDYAPKFKIKHEIPARSPPSLTIACVRNL